MGAESTSPCTWVKHLADLLRNKVNSQQYPSIFEDRRPKSIEDTEKTDKQVEAVNTRIPPGRENPPTKVIPTANNRRR